MDGQLTSLMPVPASAVADQCRFFLEEDLPDRRRRAEERVYADLIKKKNAVWWRRLLGVKFTREDADRYFDWHDHDIGPTRRWYARKGWWMDEEEAAKRFAAMARTALRFPQSSPYRQVYQGGEPVIFMSPEDHRLVFGND